MFMQQESLILEKEDLVQALFDALPIDGNSFWIIQNIENLNTVELWCNIKFLCNYTFYRASTIIVSFKDWNDFSSSNDLSIIWEKYIVDKYSHPGPSDINIGNLSPLAADIGLEFLRENYVSRWMIFNFITQRF